MPLDPVRRTAWPSSGKMAYGFDVVALEVDDKAAIVMLMIVGSQTRFAIVRSTCSHGSGIE